MDNGQQTFFESKIANKLLEVEYSAFTVLDVMNVVKKMKLGKCPGPDGIHFIWRHFIMAGSVYVGLHSCAYCLTCA